MDLPKQIYLTPPRISAAHIKKKIICIRAHRERIFDLSVQKINGKLIANNFGQGGAGWTFLFGCVNQSLRNFQQALKTHPECKSSKICVVGAGCYGLLTAILLKQAGYEVRIVAKERTDIPSHKAAGFFFPGAHKRATPEEHAVFNRIGLDSYHTYLSIINGTHPFITHGPQILPAYYDRDIDPGLGPYIKEKLLAPPQEVMLNFGSSTSHPALSYQQLYINPAEIMPQLEQYVKSLGISITQQKISSFDEVDEKIVFNCTGLGAKQLVNNSRIIPVQGHLITLKNQPPIAQLQYLINYRVSSLEPSGKRRSDFIYFAPRESGILGITFLRGRHCLQDNAHEFDRIIERSEKFFK